MYLVQKYLSDTLQNKTFTISFGFFSFQGNPVLLVAWMVYTIIFLIAIKILYIVTAVGFFTTGDPVSGAVYIIGAVIYVRK
jgi:hypothetical protein